MQKFKTIYIKKTQVTVLEVTVNDVYSFYSALPQNERMTDETIQAYIKANSVDMIARAKRVILSNKPLENFNAEEVEKTTELFFEVNAAWFAQDKNEPVSKVKKLPLLIHKAIENMAESIAVLIQNGHTNVHNYGWAFYQSVITVTNKQAENNVK